MPNKIASPIVANMVAPDRCPSSNPSKKLGANAPPGIFFANSRPKYFVVMAAVIRLVKETAINTTNIKSEVLI